MLQELIALAALSAAMSVQAGPQASIKEDSPRTGTKIRKHIAFASVPLNQRYEDLDADARAKVAARYENLAAGDEPPFPRDGEGTIIKALAEAAKLTPVSDELRLMVDVGADGAVTRVSLMTEFANSRFVEYAAQVLTATPFKPARCQGVPCAMPYPLSVRFKAP